MNTRSFVTAAVLCVAFTSVTWADAIVNYSGTVYQDSYVPVPYPNGYVIAGTFAPSFDYSEYTCVYGIDEVCNMDDNGFQRAVLDGNIIPIGAGTLADGNGMFSGSGITSAAPGTPIFLFAFGGPDSSGWIQEVAFSSSTDASFQVPASGSTQLDGSRANIHILGGSYFFDGLVLSGGLPIPEPATTWLGAICVPALLRVRRHRHV